MRLLRLKVKDVGVLRGEIEIPSFGRTLTVIHGPNETGKSTLLRALRAALFERHSAKHQRMVALRSWGGDAAPEVWVEIECEGQRYAIHKRFLSQSSALLRIEGPDAREFRGEAADEQIRELLACDAPGVQGAKPEHMGIWPLLWVDQGEAGDGLDNGRLHDGIRQRLDEALRRVVGDISGGAEGGPLLDAAREEYLRHFTAVRNQPTGELATAIKAAEQTGAALEQIRAALEASRQRADELERVARRIISDEASLNTARHQRELARREQERIEGLERRAEQAGLVRDTARGDWEQARARLVQRRKRADAIATRHQECERRQAELEPLRLEHAAAERALCQRRERLEESDRQLKAAESRLARLQVDRDLVRLRRDLETSQARFQAAEAQAAQLTAIEVQLASLLVTEAQVSALVKIQTEVTASRAALEAAAARLTVQALRATEVQTEGPCDASARRLAAGESMYIPVVQRQEFRIGDVARMVVEPGGGDLPTRQKRLDECERRYRHLLDELGVTDLSAAQAAAARRQAVEKRRSVLQAQLSAVVPEGLANLQSEVQRQRNLLQAGLAQRSTADPLPAAEAMERQLLDAESARRQIQDAFNDDRRRYEAQQSEVSRLARRLDALEGAFAQVERELANQQRELEQERSEQGSDEQLERLVAEKYTVFESRSAEAQALAEQLAACCPPRIRDEADRTASVVRQLEQELQQLERRRSELTGEVRQAGALALYEQLDGAESAHEAARTRLRSLQRQAAAANKLYEALLAARTAAQECFVQPIADRIRPLLRMVLADGEAAINQQLHLTGLHRDGQEEGFATLSGGMREQLDVLARLALAQILAGEGGTLPVILDDALVWTDDERLSRMIAALRRASAGLQIIILTCHRERYVPLGADCLVDLAELRRERTPAG
ncbi:MAG: hypothetical protein AMXMBFR13_20730 [Phycisphaerae bacterium]